MIEIHRSALVLVRADQLYHLINDIESYPQFLDGISAAEVIERSEEHMLGRLIISKGGFERTIVTRNETIEPSSIEMNLVEGPLDYLKGHWQIKALNEQGCRVSLDLSFSPMKGLKGIAFNRVFKQVSDAMVDSFVTQAHELYA